MITELAAMLKERFGIVFNDPDLLAEAFTQPRMSMNIRTNS